MTSQQRRPDYLFSVESKFTKKCRYDCFSLTHINTPFFYLIASWLVHSVKLWGTLLQFPHLPRAVWIHISHLPAPNHQALGQSCTIRCYKSSSGQDVLTVHIQAMCPSSHPITRSPVVFFIFSYWHFNFSHINLNIWKPNLQAWERQSWFLPFWEK